MASFKNFVSLIVFLVVLVGFAGIGFVVYSIVNDLSDKAKQKMEKKNIAFSKDGLKVHMKERTAEQESDDAQG